MTSKSKKGSPVDPRVETTTVSHLGRLDEQVELFYAEWKEKWNASAGASVFSWDPNHLMKGVRVAATPHRSSDHIYFVARSSLYRLDAKGMAADSKASVELVCGGFPDLFADYVAGRETTNALSGLACGRSGDGGDGVAVYSWEAADLKCTDVETRERKTVGVLGENPRGAVIKRQSLVVHPQSGNVLYCISAGVLYRVDPTSACDKREHCTGFTRDGCQITADRSHVYVLDGEGNVWQTDLAVEKPTPRKVVDGWHSEALIASPPDSLYLYSLWEKTLYAIDKETGVVTPVQSRRVWDHRITVMVAHRVSLYLFSDEGNVYRVKGLWVGPVANTKPVDTSITSLSHDDTLIMSGDRAGKVLAVQEHPPCDQTSPQRAVHPVTEPPGHSCLENLSPGKSLKHRTPSAEADTMWWWALPHAEPTPTLWSAKLRRFFPDLALTGSEDRTLRVWSTSSARRPSSHHLEAASSGAHHNVHYHHILGRRIFIGSTSCPNVLQNSTQIYF
ncbi:hypothetical protein EMCRGX_G024749 [Ephydatia muelleri]